MNLSSLHLHLMGRGVEIKVTLMQTAVQFCSVILTWRVCVCVCVCVCSRVNSVLSDSLLPYGLQCAKLLSSWNFPGKNIGAGCHFLLQRIFPNQGSNPGLLCWQVDFFLPLSLLGRLDKCKLLNKTSSLEVSFTVTEAAMAGIGDSCDRLHDWVPLCFLCFQVRV